MGMGEPTTFPYGKTRHVCVNRKAILHNMQHNTNYPTAIVVEDGVLFEFHTVHVSGDLSFDKTRTDLPAQAFIESREQIVGYLLFNNERSFLSLKFRSGFFHKLKIAFYRFMGKVPLASCLVEGLEEKLSKPIYQPRPIYNLNCRNT